MSLKSSQKKHLTDFISKNQPLSGLYIQAACTDTMPERIYNLKRFSAMFTLQLDNTKR